MASATASTGGGDVDLAAVGALVADRRRCQILLALNDRRALPASRLAHEAGVSAATTSIQSLRQGTRAAALREARTCYDHVAGKLGVGIMAALLDKGYLVGGDGSYDPEVDESDVRAGFSHDVDYALTREGDELLAEFGVQAPPRRRLIRYCVDWSEQRHHLSGALGRGLLDRLLALDWIRPRDSSRAVRITDTGREGLRTTFGIDLS